MDLIEKSFNLLNEFPENIQEAYNLEVPLINNKEKIKKILIIGMGGCYVSGLILKDILNNKIKIPIEISAGSLKKEQIDKFTLIILVSYSGNTKEIIDSFYNLKKYKKNIFVISSGGKILKIISKSRAIKLPENKHQRFTLAYTCIPIIKFLERSGLISSYKKNIREIIKAIHKNKEQINKEARKIVLKIKEKIPLIYSCNSLYSVAYRFQTSIEEDAKVICHSNKITEIFHNELEALPDKRFFPILILDKKQIKPYQQQISFFKQHIGNYYEFGFEKYRLELRIFLLIYLIDFIGYHLFLFKELNKNLLHKTPLSDKIKSL